MPCGNSFIPEASLKTTEPLIPFRKSLAVLNAKNVFIFLVKPRLIHLPNTDGTWEHCLSILYKLVCFILRAVHLE